MDKSRIKQEIFLKELKEKKFGEDAVVGLGVIGHLPLNLFKTSEIRR